MGDMVDFTNRLLQGLTGQCSSCTCRCRAIDHDDAYFEPLQRLQFKPETELCLGLVHHTDGVDGTRRRMATAQRHVADFSIATECGFGRRDPATIPELLHIHEQVAELNHG